MGKADTNLSSCRAHILGEGDRQRKHDKIQSMSNDDNWGKRKQRRGRGKAEVEADMDGEGFSEKVTFKGGPGGREEGANPVDTGGE